MPRQSVPLQTTGTFIPGDVPNVSRKHKSAAFERWAAQLSGFADRTLISKPEDSQSWSLSTWLLGDIHVKEISTGCEEIVRRPSHVRQSYSEYVALHLSLHGGRHAIVDDQAFFMGPGEIHIHDLNRPLRFVTPSPLSALAVFVPYSAIGYDPSKHRTTTSIPVPSPTGQMLRNAMMAMRVDREQMQESDVPAVAAGFSGLVRGLVMHDVSDEKAQHLVADSRTQLIKAFIESNLTGTELDTTSLCRRFRVSRATMYRLFAEDGGVAHYVTERRLVHAFKQLRTTAPHRGRVKEIAESLGFDDHSHFNRLFRSKFHLSPSEALGLWCENQSAPAQSAEPIPCA